jgi:hypothetical protein
MPDKGGNAIDRTTAKTIDAPVKNWGFNAKRPHMQVAL